MKLYNYQIQSVEAMAENEQDHDIVVLNNATGSGKTVTLLTFLQAYSITANYINEYIQRLVVQKHIENVYLESIHKKQLPLNFDYYTFFPKMSIIIVQNSLITQWQNEIANQSQEFQNRCCYFKGELNSKKAIELQQNGQDIILMVFSTSQRVTITPGRLICDELTYTKRIKISAVKHIVLSADDIFYTEYGNLSPNGFSTTKPLTCSIVKVPVEYTIQRVEHCYALNLPKTMTQLIKLSQVENSDILNRLLEDNRFFSDDLKLGLDDYIEEVSNRMGKCKKNSEMYNKHHLTLTRLEARKKEAHCAICYEDDIDIKKLATLPCCQNTLCIECVYHCNRNHQQNCPYCKKRDILNTIHIRPVDVENPVTRLDAIKYLLNQFPDDKFIFFSFNDDIYNSELHELLIGNYSSTGFYDRKRIMEKFQKNEYRGLYLNGYEHATGLNLIQANHVVLMHNISNENTKNQMIGRVLRLGQQKQVYIHQFYFIGQDDAHLYNADITPIVL